MGWISNYKQHSTELHHLLCLDHLINKVFWLPHSMVILTKKMNDDIWICVEWIQSIIQPMCSLPCTKRKEVQCTVKSKGTKPLMKWQSSLGIPWAWGNTRLLIGWPQWPTRKYKPEKTKGVNYHPWKRHSPFIKKRVTLQLLLNQSFALTPPQSLQTETIINPFWDRIHFQLF